MNLFIQSGRLFPYGEVDRDITQRLRANWIRSVKRLGNKWLYHKDNQVLRKGT